MGFARRSFLLSIVLIGLAAAPAAADVSLALKTTGVGATVQLTPTGQFTGCNSSGYCFYHFPNGSIVTLKASPSTPASSFVRWLGACAGAGMSCTIRLDSNRSTVARFSPVQLFADEVSGKGSASVSPVGTSCGFGCWEYAYGTVVTVTAQAAPDWAFRSWSGVCAGVTVPGCRFTMFGSAETSPAFRCTADICSTTQPIVREVNTTVHVLGSGGYVTVNGSRCSSRTCTFTYNRGKSVVLRAYGSGFRSWSGWCATSTPRCQFSAFKDPYNHAPEVTANFG